ncbi:mitochondrial carrier domain-containing protein [Pavlovales sp. CCMP2436]|nr:mitochondrial carrier domain-containing protein [Pavlovales sp. CCMP2436]|mmetsp:Transcript_33274/g.82893  ORF Transcript_33274/g.82893 Transcript_33274/m.82893 type:complete len:311 (+) Transcript_33274:3-935(+)
MGTISRDFAIDAAAGWVAGAASVFASQPLDTVLTRLQQAPPSVRPFSLVQELRREGGVRSLWRGTSPLALVVPLQNALLFAGYGMGERCANYLSAQRSVGADAAAGGGKAAADASPPLLPIFAGGCVGGVLQCFVVSPFELVKVHLQSSSSLPRATSGLLAGASHVYATVGVPAIWRGLGATLLRDGLPHGVWFTSYEWAKRRLAASERARTLPADVVPLSCGAFAAVVAWGVGYPADIIKTRIQMPQPAGAAPPSVLATARALLAESGGHPIRAFYRGFGLKLLRAVPMNALSFVVYERAKTAMESTWA